MKAIISLLPDPFYRQVEQLWDQLENEVGLRGIRSAPFPHFSWQGAQEYEENGLELILKTMADLSKPIKVQTSGLGLFTGKYPVIFINVIKSPQLMRMHQQIWSGTRPIGKEFNLYYEPDVWQPHISIAMEDVTPEKIGPVMKELSVIEFNWTFEIDNFAYFVSASPAGRIKHKFLFGQKTH